MIGPAASSPGPVGFVVFALAVLAALLAVIMVLRARRQARAEVLTPVPGPPGEDGAEVTAQERPGGRRPFGLLLAILVVAISVASVEGVTRIGGSRTTSTTVSPQVWFREARDGVCAAADIAHAGDLAGAGRAFFNRSHLALHELAKVSAVADRAAAARLLEAKAVVEGAVTRLDPSLGQGLIDLATATGRAMAAAGGDDPGPCR